MQVASSSTEVNVTPAVVYPTADQTRSAGTVTTLMGRAMATDTTVSTPTRAPVASVDRRGVTARAVSVPSTRSNMSRATVNNAPNPAVSKNSREGATTGAAEDGRASSRPVQSRARTVGRVASP